MMISEEGKSKSRTFVVSSIIKKLDKMNLNGEHSQQRDFVWEKIKQYNLISDVLQNNPLPELVFAEQIVNNASIIWVIDGKQRCTTLKEYVENKFAIGANVTRYMISYSEPVKDEDDCIVRDEDGNVVYELKEFDIRKKRFKELPDILKEKLLDYAFNVVYYCNCTDDEIAYHIQRYNSGKPMNVAQKGMTFIGKRNSDAVRSILAMSFFVDGIGAYTASQFTSSTMSRVVAESIMTTGFLDNWCKKYEDNCKFLEQNATADDFEDFKSLVLELEDEIECSVGKMFNDTDSFLWFGLYAQFKKIGLKCSDFNIFMNEINKGITRNNKGKIDKKEPMSGICVKEIDGVTLEQLLSNPSTKDTNIVKTKINFLVRLACEYFGLELPNFESDKNNTTVENFISEFVATNIPHNTKSTALKTLMQFKSDYPVRDFTSVGVKNFNEWLKNNPVNEEVIDDCLMSATLIRDYLNNAGAADKFSENDIAILVYQIFSYGENLDEDIFEAWLEDYNNVNNCEQSGESASILEKDSFLRESYSNFINYITNDEGEMTL